MTIILLMLDVGVNGQEYLILMNDRNAGFYEVKKAAEEYFIKDGKGKGSGYKQYKRWEWFVEERIYPRGDMSVLSSNNLYREISTFRSKYPLSKDNGNKWAPVPMRVYDNVDGHWSPGTGRMDRVMLDPTDPDIIYTGAPTGGLWKSTDGGLHWETKTDGLPSIGISGIAIDPTDTDIIYISTGDGDGTGTYSSGIFKSTDAGETWISLSLSFEADNNIQGKKLIIHPINPDILFFTSSTGIYKTTDSGLSWRRVMEGQFDDIEFNTGNPSIVYATQNDAFYRSVNTGESFTRISVQASGRIIIGVTKAAPSYVYLASGKEGIFLSNDEGKSFKFIGEHPFEKGLKWYMWAFAVSQTDPDILHIGEIESYKSVDGGVTWSEKTTEWLWNNEIGYTHCDFHEMKYFGDTLYVCTDGGLAKTTDEGESWELYFNGVETTQIYNISVCKSDTGMIMFGSQDNGVYYHTINGWWGWLGGDGMDVIYDYNNPATRYATIQNGELYCSDHSIEQAGMGGWVTPLAIHPENPEILYIATDVIRKSTDRMASWITIGDFGSDYKKSLSVAESDPDYIYASEEARVWKTINGGDTWTEVSNGLPDLMVTSIAVHPLKPDVIAVSLSGYKRGEKVYISYDAGNTWSNYSMNLPNIPANRVVFGQYDNNPLYVGMDVGVYYTNDDLALYDDYSNGLPDAIVRDLEINYQTGLLFAGTYGRGVWKIKTAAPVITDLPGQPGEPYPADGAVNVSTRLDLAWEPGNQTQGHNVYFGTSDPPVMVSQEQNEMTFTPTGLEPGKKYYWKIDEVNSLGITAGPIWSFTTDEYCTAFGREGTTADYITGVVLSDLENLTGQESFGNFTEQAASLVKGMSYTLMVTLGYHWNLDTISAWIDWNDDKMFSSAEKITMTVIGADNISRGTFTVPGEAVTGQLRMRVRNIYNAPSDPCGEYYGEVEDYTVVVSEVNPDLPLQAGYPLPADDAVYVPPDTVLIWSPGGGASSHEVFFSEDPGAGDTELTPVQGDTVFDPGALKRSTTYYWRIDEINEYGRTAGQLWRFTTDSYCPALSSGNMDDSYISQVQYATVTNASSSGLYTFYNDLRGVISISEEMFVNVTLSSSDGNEKMYVWVDWNGNKEFEDGESLDMSDLNTSFVSSGSVIVPAEAIPGITRIRVRMSGETAGACNIVKGETEDYLLLILKEPAPPAKASTIIPVDDGENVSTVPALRWLPGARVASHELYFGTENPPPFVSSMQDSVYLPGNLSENTIYYWKVDEVNNGGNTTGDIWTFRTYKSDVNNALKIDFGTYFTPVADGYAPYRAEDKNMSAYHEELYGALGSNITLGISYAQGTTDEEVIMADRGGNDNTLSPDLLRDWAGVDASGGEKSMILTFKEVPEGTYKWTSYHHDPHDQTGMFYVKVNDASGTTESDQLDISDGSLMINNVSKFMTTIESDGSDIEIIFTKPSEQDVTSNMFVINAFVLDTLITEDIPDIVTEGDNTYFKLYPNPVSSLLNLDFYTDNGTVRLIITDVKGRTYYSAYHRGSKVTIDVRSYPPGIYNLVMIRRELLVVKKFIVN